MNPIIQASWEAATQLSLSLFVIIFLEVQQVGLVWVNVLHERANGFVPIHMCFVCSCIYEENPSRSIKNIRKSGKNPLKIHFKILEKSKKISPRSGCYPSSMLRSLGGWSVGLAASPGHFCHQSCGGAEKWPMCFDALKYQHGR